MAQMDWGWWQRSLWPERSGRSLRAGPGHRPWLVLMGPMRAWPRTAWGLAAVGTLFRAAEALSLTPSPLPRVKFLLMDARGSPQAETRWSDPITLHQGSAGGQGCSGSSLPCGPVSLCKLILLSRPFPLLP